ncbi:MAG: ABC transporter permease [Clostridia bacterium]|nr:ABC transporter permease [Clostridia bacterium]
MLNIINLIRNENMKNFRVVSTWVMVAILLLMVAIGGIITKTTSNSEGNKDWKAEISKQNEQFKSMLSEQQGLPKAVKDRYEKDIKINEYRIKHDIPPVETNTLWGFVISCIGIIAIVSLFTIIKAASSVASEFSSGTIKLLLIRPAKRWKILLSKYISAMLFAIGLLVVLFSFSFILGGVLFSFKGASHPYLAFVDGAVVEKSMVLNVFGKYGLACVDSIMMVTFAFMISTVFRNSALAIGLSIFLMFTGGTIVGLLSKYDWVKYILFANTDLTQYIDGTPLVEGMTMAFSIVMIIIYFAAFNFISWFNFSKRDVAA